MIFVMLGTQNNSFHRLLEKIEECIDKNIINDSVVVQSGNTEYKSDKMKLYDFLSSDEMNKNISDADYIITHGGVGSIIDALNKNKKVIAVSRKAKYKEHVNDHQIQIVQEFNSKGYIIGIDDVDNLEEAISKIDDFHPNKYMSNNKNFVKIIEEYIDNN